MNLSRTIVQLSRESNGDRAAAAEPAVRRFPMQRSSTLWPRDRPLNPGPAAPNAPQAALVGAGLTATMR